VQVLARFLAQHRTVVASYPLQVLSQLKPRSWRPFAVTPPVDLSSPEDLCAVSRRSLAALHYVDEMRRVDSDASVQQPNMAQT